MEDLRNYVTKIKDKQNPFVDNTFDICCAESYGKYVDSYSVRKCLITFNNQIIQFSYPFEDRFIACYCAIFTLNNNYGYDPLSYIKNTDIIAGSDYIESYNKLLSISEKTKIISIIYSNTEYGKNAFEYHSQVIIFEINKYKTDFFFYDEEYKRRNK